MATDPRWNRNGMTGQSFSATTKLFAAVLALFGVVLSASVFGAGVPVRSVTPTSTGHRIDLNRADAATLQLLPGIGAVVAGHVVEHRQEAGRFTVLDDLQRVRMIGPKVCRRVEAYVTLE